MTIEFVRHTEAQKTGGKQITLTFMVDNEDTARFYDWIAEKVRDGKMSIWPVPDVVETALEDTVEAIMDAATSLPGTIDDRALRRVVESAVRERLTVFGVSGCYPAVRRSALAAV